MSKIVEFLRALNQRTLVFSHSSKEEPDIQYFIWLVDTPAGQLCQTEDHAFELAFSIWGDAPLPFFLAAASVERSAALRKLGLEPLFLELNLRD